MNRPAGIGLIAGTVIGFLMLVVIIWSLRSATLPEMTQPPGVSPDVTVFLSEQSLSRMASDTLEQPVVIDFEANGQLRVSTQTQLRGLEPVVWVMMTLELQGTEIVSQLRWIELGILTIPADWLPANARNATALIGETIKTQTPPDFTITGLTTTSEGVTLQLKWVGR